ncbi:unnamed protein product [Ectocarpus sp. 6 AP-2014]
MVVSSRREAAAAILPQKTSTRGRRSQRWAFMCTDTGVLAWEQGMVAAERPGAAVRADEACLQFEHPAMMHELAMMAPLGGKIAVTRVVALGPTDFLCGLSRGGILRLRPGLEAPILLTQKTTSVLGRGFSTIRRMGVSTAR